MLTSKFDCILIKHSPQLIRCMFNNSVLNYFDNNSDKNQKHIPLATLMGDKHCSGDKHIILIHLFYVI